MSKFHVKVGRISGEGLPPQCSNPYLKFNFDNYKLFQTETGDGQDPEFDFSLFFVYETRYIDKLAKKDLEIALYNKKKFSSDKCFGTVSVDLLTVASGPVKHSLPLSEGGRISFSIEMSHICEVTTTLDEAEFVPANTSEHISAQLSARYTGEENDLQQKKFESEKSPVSATPKWAPLKLYFKATQYGLMTESIEVTVKKIGIRNDTIGTCTLPLSDFFFGADVDSLHFAAPVMSGPTPVGTLQADISMRHCPQYTNMVGGCHTEDGYEDAVPLFAQGGPSGTAAPAYNPMRPAPALDPLRPPPAFPGAPPAAPAVAQGYLPGGPGSSTAASAGMTGYVPGGPTGGAPAYDPYSAFVNAPTATAPTNRAIPAYPGAPTGPPSGNTAGGPAGYTAPPPAVAPTGPPGYAAVAAPPYAGMAPAPRVAPAYSAVASPMPYQSPAAPTGRVLPAYNAVAGGGGGAGGAGGYAPPPPAVAPSSGGARAPPSYVNFADASPISATDTQWHRDASAARTAFSAGRYTEAVTAWTRALAMSNDDDDLVAAYNGRAEAYLRQSKNSHAIDDCNAVLDISPTNVQALMNRSKSYENTNRNSEALIDVVSVLSIEPGNQKAKMASIRLASAPEDGFGGSSGGGGGSGGSSRQEPELPPFWEEMDDGHGNKYYFDHAEQKRHDYLPGQEPRGGGSARGRTAARSTGRRTASANSSSGRTLPPFWEEKTDTRGRTFYIDHRSRKTQWEFPTE